MTLNKMMETAIKEYIKDRELFKDIKGLKVIKTKYLQTVKCYDDVEMTTFTVTCSIKAKKYEDNRLTFNVNLYDDDGNEDVQSVMVMYTNSFYEA